VILKDMHKPNYLF